MYKDMFSEGSLVTFVILFSQRLIITCQGMYGMLYLFKNPLYFISFEIYLILNRYLI